jgi:hypothetical protein
MAYRWAWLCALAFSAGNALAVDAPDDTVIVPGKRVGAVTAHMSEAALKSRLPKGYVTHSLYQETRAGSNAQDGPLRCISKVYPPESGKEIWVIWKSDFKNTWDIADGERCDNARGLASPAYVLLFTPETPHHLPPPWKTRNGVGIGITLAQLEAANGKPVTFSIDGDSDGDVVDWNGGARVRTIADASLVYDTSEVSDRLKLYAKDPAHARVLSSDVPEAFKPYIRLALFSVPMS